MVIWHLLDMKEGTKKHWLYEKQYCAGFRIHRSSFRSCLKLLFILASSPVHFILTSSPLPSFSLESHAGGSYGYFCLIKIKCLKSFSEIILVIQNHWDCPHWPVSDFHTFIFPWTQSLHMWKAYICRLSVWSVVASLQKVDPLHKDQSMRGG